MPIKKIVSCELFSKPNRFILQIKYKKRWRTNKRIHILYLKYKLAGFSKKSANSQQNFFAQASPNLFQSKAQSNTRKEMAAFFMKWICAKMRRFIQNGHWALQQVQRTQWTATDVVKNLNATVTQCGHRISASLCEHRISAIATTTAATRMKIDEN